MPPNKGSPSSALHREPVTDGRARSRWRRCVIGSRLFQNLPDLRRGLVPRNAHGVGPRRGGGWRVQKCILVGCVCAACMTIEWMMGVRAPAPSLPRLSIGQGTNLRGWRLWQVLMPRLSGWQRTLGRCCQRPCAIVQRGSVTLAEGRIQAPLPRHPSRVFPGIQRAKPESRSHGPWQSFLDPADQSRDTHAIKPQRSTQQSRATSVRKRAQGRPVASPL